MATAKQLAWRREFAKRAKSGTLKKNPTKRKATKRRGPSKVNAPSQATGAKPTPRLKARRRANTKPGVYPNPIKSPFKFQVRRYTGSKMGSGSTSDWAPIAGFITADLASDYAKALAKAHPTWTLHVWV